MPPFSACLQHLAPRMHACFDTSHVYPSSRLTAFPSVKPYGRQRLYKHDFFVVLPLFAHRPLLQSSIPNMLTYAPCTPSGQPSGRCGLACICVYAAKHGVSIMLCAHTPCVCIALTVHTYTSKHMVHFRNRNSVCWTTTILEAALIWTLPTDSLSYP